VSLAGPHHQTAYRPATDIAALVLGAATVGSVASGSRTSGRFGLFRWDMGPHAGGPDPHFHTTFSESFYVLDGTVRLGDGTTWRDATAGDYLYVPEGGVHAFRNDGDAPASMLIPPDLDGGLVMISVRVIVDDAVRAAEWYATVLGAEERNRITLPDGRLIDVELWFGESRLVLADEFPEHAALSPKKTGCTSAVLYLDVEDVDSVWTRALENGAEVLRPLADWFTGDRDGQVVDPFGHRWGLSQHVRDGPSHDVSRAEAFGAAARSMVRPGEDG
jgi:PhnB protein